jgi:hypothetical protein
MDSSPVDEAWETEGAGAPASDRPPASADHRTALQVIADLRHPHLLVTRRKIDGVGFETELGGGMSLAELSRSEAGWFPLPLRVGLRILLDALSGLAAIHQATQNGKPLEFVHGEVAPSNIFVGQDGLGRLVPVLPAHWDERAHPNPDVTGYIAPERLLGDVFGQPADVFSAGVLLWEAITGKPLFRNWPLEAIVTQLIGRKVPYPIPVGDALWGVPLADVAMRALLVDPAERWIHVGALGAQIETIARGHLASSDEIAALVAGFAAGKGPSSRPPVSDVATIPPPPPPSQVTSLSPTASSIQSPPPQASLAPIEEALPDPPAALERWEAPATLESRIWIPPEPHATPSDGIAASATSPEVAESWSGIAPASIPAMSRRSKTIAWAVVSACLAVTGLAAYRLIEQSPETRSTATVLAPKGSTPGQASAVYVVGAAPKVAPEPAVLAAPQAIQPQPAGSGDSARKTMEGSTTVTAPAAPTAMPGSHAPGAPANVNRATPRAVTRPAPPPPPPPAVAAPPRPAPSAPPPPAPPAVKQPKPKEDIFGI